MDHPLLGLPPLDALRGFAAVARRMSITLAAQDLCLTQSAVSRQIQSLEEHFGTPLFLRKNRALELTDAGRQLATIVTPWLEQLADFNRKVRGPARSKPLVIATSSGIASLWLLPRLAAFNAEHPHIDVRVNASTQILDMRQEGIDLALRYAPQSNVPAGSARLFDEMILPVARPDIAARAFAEPDALLDEVLLEFDERTVPWLRWPDWLQALKLHQPPRAYLHCNQYDQVARGAADGLGVALGRLPLILPQLKSGQLAAAPVDLLRHTGYAYWLVESPTSLRPEAHALRDWLLGEAAATAAAVDALARSAAPVA
ncbi:LysR family transcriptional regulator [Massilia arenosa]|uniref:LysR family transcriptional regulator n=1 Tax=Zemynaea arenosa TaxID=2561931 RepID=A0A4Y9SIY7_9BURK|nr:LysR substrate-binding domain-containing protein [Massilia arenosa]TFW25791.1 LysR family transcriptional regulator [Massilia arenosa]